MQKSIMSMADDILGGALSDASKVNESTVQSESQIVKESRELPEIEDSAREALIADSVMYMETMAPAQRDPEQQKKKAEWEEKNREKRKAQRMARTVRGARNEPGEEQRQQRHMTGRGKKKGQPGHVDTRSKTSGSIGNAPHWRGEVEKTKKGTSTDFMSTPAGTKLAKKFHKDTINKSRKQRGATELAHLTSDQKLILKQAREIMQEMTSVGAINMNMAGSANKAYGTDAKAMGKDNVPVEPVDKSLRKVMKKATKKKAKKKEDKMKKESFENFLDAILTENQK